MFPVIFRLLLDQIIRLEYCLMCIVSVHNRNTDDDYEMNLLSLNSHTISLLFPFDKTSLIDLS